MAPVSYLEMTEQELAGRLGSAGRPSSTRARALLRWIWRGGDDPFSLPERVEGVSARALDALRRSTAGVQVRVAARAVGEDGTTKLLLDLDGVPVETVMIPGRGRTTVCVSSQSGCSRHCTFCATARMGFRRNLTAAEMIAQVLAARSVAPAGAPARNVVFMGMGEPMDNLDAVVRAVSVLEQPAGAAVSPGHVTVSTSGVLPAMERFVARSNAGLAISLNATTDEQRSRLMSVARRWSIRDLVSFIGRHGGDRIFFVEYILMGGFNDSERDADRLAGMLADLPVRVNLIPFNPFDGSTVTRPAPERIDAFFSRLNAQGIRTMVRRPRGADIAAACGQLYRAHAEKE